MKLREIGSLLKETFKEWQDDDALQWGAALAYYAIFSLAPLLIVAIGIAGLVLDRQAVEGEILGQLQGLLGEQGAELIRTMLESAERTGSGVLATVVGLATLLFGASGVFGQLQKALNHMWQVEPAPGGGIKRLLWTRLTAFGMVLAIGFLLLVSLVVSAGLAAVGRYAEGFLPLPPALLQVLNVAISLVVVTALFALLFRVLPDVEIAWRDVLVGAAATALLFTLGKLLIGLYLGRSSVGSAYGAAGSLVVLLLWIYYSAQLLFLGAELTQVWARRYGSRIQPAPGAVRVEERVVTEDPAADRNAAGRQVES